MPGVRLSGVAYERAQEVFHTLSTKWTLSVLAALHADGSRFGDIRQSVNAEMSDPALSATLDRLLAVGWLVRVRTSGWHRPVYQLTPTGRSLLDTLPEHLQWADTHWAGADLA